MLDSRVLPLLPFLAPSISSKWLANQARSTAFQYHTTLNGHHLSPFHTAARQHARAPSSSPADLSFLDEPTDSQQRQQSEGYAFEPTEKPNLRSKIDEELDRLIPMGNSATNVRKAYQATKRQDGEIASRMKLPSTLPSKNDTLEMLSLRNIAPRNKRTVRSRPTVGRTIELDPSKGMDFGRGLRQLGMLCTQNNVRGDLMSQRFHERPGMKRKRLKQQRWRKLFKSGFAATVGRVKEMRRKGW